MVRPRALGAPAARLGDPALRPLLAAPGPGLRASRDAVAIRPGALRRGHRAGHDGAAAPGAPLLPRGAHLRFARPRAPGPRAAARAARPRRLFPRAAGDEP